MLELTLMNILFVWLRRDQLGSLSVSRGAKAGAESVEACLSMCCCLQQETVELLAYELTHSDHLRLMLLLLRTECVMAGTDLTVATEVVLLALD